MARQQQLFEFQGKQIQASSIKLKSKGIPCRPLAEDETVEIAIKGSAHAFHFERDKDGRLTVVATVSIAASKILAAGTFETLENAIGVDRETVTEIMRETADRINAGELDTDEFSVTAKVAEG